MKYLVTSYKDNTEKQKIESKGLYCYDLRHSDEGGEIATIEKSVLVNRIGSIITDKELKFGNKYYNNFIDFEEFSARNTEVYTIEQLQDNPKEKVNENSHKVSGINTKLSRCTKQKALRICNQRTKICHGSYSHENQRRQNAPLIHKEEIVKKPSGMFDSHGIHVRFGHDVRVNIHKQHTKGNRNQKQWFKSLLNRQIQEETGHADHGKIADGQIQECCLLKKITHCICNIIHVNPSIWNLRICVRPSLM